MLDSMSGSITNDSEQGEVRTVRRRYLVGQAEGFNDAVQKVEQYAPPYVQSDGAGIYWVRKQLDVTSVGNKYFDCTTTYQTLQPKQEDGGGGQNDAVPGGISWDTTGNTEHRTQARNQRKYGANSPDFQKAINVSGDSVNGIDVVAPSMRYSETWILPVSVAVSCDYVGGVYTLTGTLNAAQFRCFPPRSCLFLGARGQWQGDLPYVTVTFDFEARPPVTIDVSGGAPELNGVQIQKEGWEHLWFLYGKDVDENSLIQVPVAAYVDTLYEEKDWGPLLIVAAAPPVRPRTPRPPVNPPLPPGWIQNP